MNGEHLKWMVIGVVALLALKYLVFGLTAWDAVLHPGRTEPSDSPFLNGVFA